MSDFKYFSYDEFVASVTAKNYGIDNRIPNDKVRKNIRNLVGAVLDPLRELVGQPIFITSGYRCNELNRLLKGSKNSQHMTGEAADITTYDAYGNMVIVINLLSSHKMGEADPELYELDIKLSETVDFFDFDQLIMYRQTRDKFNYTWLHVSFRGNVKNRRQVMMCHNGEYRILGIEEQQRLVFDLSEQIDLHDNTLKEKYKPSN